MLSQKQLDDLLYQMTSFYRDYLPNDNALMKLFNAYSQTIDYVWTLFGEASDSRFVSTTRTAATLPYFRVNIDDAMYSPAMAQKLQEMSSFESQISYLDSEQIFSSFIFTTQDNSGTPQVMGMRLCTDFAQTQLLKLYQDYFIRSNRLYLLPGYILGRTQTLHYLHAFDIKLDDNTLEKNFGALFSLKVGTLLPRYEYRDVLEAFTRVFQSQMSIKSIRESITLATKWKGFDIQDYKSPTISDAKKRLYDNYIISPLRFIVSLPEELIPDKINANIVRTLLDEAKQSQTDYMVFFEILRGDEYPVPDEDVPTIHYQRGERPDLEDDHSVSQMTMGFMEYALDTAGRYDSHYEYDLNAQFDDPPDNDTLTPTITAKNIVDDGQIPDTITVTHHTLMIPRHFAGSINVSTDVITFSMDPNQDTTTQLQIYGSSDLNGTYSLLTAVTNNKTAGASGITFTYNSANTGMFYYIARATDGTNFSMFTLPITAFEKKLFDDADVLNDTYTLDDTHAFNTIYDGEDFISYVFNAPVHEGIDTSFYGITHIQVDASAHITESPMALRGKTSIIVKAADNLVESPMVLKLGPTSIHVNAAANITESPMVLKGTAYLQTN